MCEFCKWKDLVTEVDKLLAKKKKKDFIFGLLTAMKQRMKREKHCTHTQREAIESMKFIEANAGKPKPKRKRKKK